MNILIINEDQPFCDTVCRLIKSSGHHAKSAVSSEAGLTLLKDSRFDGLFLDMESCGQSGLELLLQIRREHVELPVVMLASEGSVATAVEAMRLGAIDFLEKPFTSAQLHLTVTRMRLLKSINQKIEQLVEAKSKMPHTDPGLLLDFTSPAMCHVRDVLERAAKSPATILITGESGTGKSVLAHAIHSQSHLASRPFVTVSCPSLSRDLLESELFGHTRGSFTGAIKDRWGKVKAAAGGTLFLDEIGDLPMEIQPKLLRLLQEKEYERLGENVTYTANLRVIAATNCDLKKRVREGTFREDLYFRLNVIAVEMPPLRARNNDLLPLARHYLQYFGAECGRKMRPFSSGIISRMEAHSWPGNLRELRNAIQRAIILTAKDQIGANDLLLEVKEPEAVGPSHQPGDLISLKKLAELHLQRVLDRTGSISESARILGINQATIYRWRREWVNNKSLTPELVC